MQKPVMKNLLLSDQETMGKEGTGQSHRHNLKHRFNVMKTLGQGTYGKVKLAVEKSTGIKYAVKMIRKRRICSEQDLQRIRREIQIMASLSHPHIATVHEVFENRDKIILVMEFADGGELYDYINLKQGLDEDEARRFFRQIISAVRYLHASGIVHRDLKLENILLDASGDVKIADFGLANLHCEDRLLSTFCGSPLYASPEIVNGLPYYGPEVDCWSLGVLLYTLVYGAMPFDGGDFRRLRHQITAGDYLEPPHVADASGLIRQLLTPNPSKRATVDDVCEHWWINVGYDNSMVEDCTQGKPVDWHQLDRSLSSSTTTTVSSDSDSDSHTCDQDDTDQSPHTPTVMKGILKKSPSKEQTPELRLHEAHLPQEDEDEAVFVDENSSPSDVYNPESSKTQEAVSETPPPVSVQKTVSFDSEKKPMRGILKRGNKRQYTGSDSGCVMEGGSVSLEKPSLDCTNGQVCSCTECTQGEVCMCACSCDIDPDRPDNTDTTYDLDDIQDVLDTIVNGEDMSNSHNDYVSSVAPSTSTPHSLQSTIPTIPTSSYDTSTCNLDTRSGLVSSTKRVKGILKRNGRFSSSYDPSWRYSSGSQGSNSSGDLLDFSYDSADGEAFMAEYCSVLRPVNISLDDSLTGSCPVLSTMEPGQEVEEEEEEDPAPPLPLQPPPAHPPPALLDYVNDLLDTTQDLVHSHSKDGDLNNCLSAETRPILENVINLTNNEVRMSNTFDIEEARNVYQQARHLCEQFD